MRANGVMKHIQNHIVGVMGAILIGAVTAHDDTNHSDNHHGDTVHRGRCDCGLGEGEMLKCALSDEAIEWILHGEQGTSSRTMFDVFIGDRIQDPFKSHPYDTDDFRRCEKLLRQVPEFRGRLYWMIGVSLEWALLVEKWDEIVKSFEQEVPGIFDHEISRRNAPKTYDLIAKTWSGGFGRRDTK